MKNLFNKYFPIITGAFIFMLFALYNGYAILNGDSVTYINSGFGLYVPSERPIFYGIFLKLTSLGLTVWTSIFVQSILLSYLATSFIKSIIPTITKFHIIALLLIISLGTIASWYAGQLLPDIFTPILFLATYLYLKNDNRKAQSIVLVFIIYCAILVHYSHYVIATLFPILLLIIKSIKKDSITIAKAKILHLLGIAFIAWVSLFTTNILAGHGVTTGKMSHVFLMGKLTENGILKKYLDKSCPTEDYNICNYKDSLPPVAWEFVWNLNSPVYKFGGIDANKSEYNTIIKRIVTNPKYWPILAFKSMEATMRQVILMNIDESEERDWIHFETGDPIYESIKKHYPSELNQLKVSKQNYSILNIPFYDDVYVIIFLLTTLFILFTINDKNKKNIIITYILVLLFIFLNAFATATFGNVLTRLNSRAIWLIPMTNIVFIYKYINERITYRLNQS